MLLAVLSRKARSPGIVQNRPNLAYGFTRHTQPVIYNNAGHRLLLIASLDPRLFMIELKSFVVNDVTNSGQNIADGRRRLLTDRPRNVVRITCVTPAKFFCHCRHSAIQLVRDQI